jgi:hypothetical protein
VRVIIRYVLQIKMSASLHPPQGLQKMPCIMEGIGSGLTHSFYRSDVLPYLLL